MRYIVTGDEMREYDKNTIERIGIPSLVLMERAAMAVASVIVQSYKPCNVLIVCAVGNNGADGLALARLLLDLKYDVSICIIGDKTRASKQFKEQLHILAHYEPRWIEKPTDVRRQSFDVIIDALFGVGLSREVTGEYALMIEQINAMDGYKVAVDIPSGICTDTGKVLGCAFRADVTVTFAYAKKGMYYYPGNDYVGQLVVADIGINEKAFGDKKPAMFTYNESPHILLPQRRADGNKGTFGKVLIIAGFEHMIGAAIISARAALEMGAGMVKVLCPIENRAILQSAVAEVLYGTCEELEESLVWADVVVVGPGLGKSSKAVEILEQVLAKATHPLVLDADALNLISEVSKLQQVLKVYDKDIILTPHMGELARLAHTGVSDVKEHITDIAMHLAKEYHVVMVCKDAQTLVASQDKDMLYLNVSGNNGMATAGSGDALTGMIGALLAQKEPAFEAACKGVYLHGFAGSEAANKYTQYGVTASRIIDNIKDLYRDL